MTAGLVATGDHTSRVEVRSGVDCFALTVLLAVLVLMWGCAGLASGNSSQPITSPPPTHAISGTITPAAGGAGATVSLSGASSATAVASSTGAYTFGGLLNGTYAVTPSHAGYAFTPGTQTVTISGLDVTGVNFTANIQSGHSVSLTWGPSPTTTVTGYNVYRSTLSGSLYTKIGNVLVPSVSYTDTTVQSGTTYYYVATAVDTSNNESVYSNQVSAAIP